MGGTPLEGPLSDVGVQSITGLTVEVAEPGVTGEVGKLVLIAQSEAGYRNLMELSSSAFLTPVGDDKRVAFASVLAHSEGLICLTGGITGSMFLLGEISDRWGLRRALLFSLAFLVLARLALALGPTLHLSPGLRGGLFGLDLFFEHLGGALNIGKFGIRFGKLFFRL